MLWFLVWSVLVVAAAVVLFLVGRGVFRKGLALVTTLGEASERLAAIQAQVERLGGEPAAPAAPAVFDDPALLRRERDRLRRAGRRRRAARTSSRP